MAIAEMDGRRRLCEDWVGDMMCAEIYEKRGGGQFSFCRNKAISSLFPTTAVQGRAFRFEGFHNGLVVAGLVSKACVLAKKLILIRPA